MDPRKEFSLKKVKGRVRHALPLWIKIAIPNILHRFQSLAQSLQFQRLFFDLLIELGFVAGNVVDGLLRLLDLLVHVEHLRLQCRLDLG